MIEKITITHTQRLLDGKIMNTPGMHLALMSIEFAQIVSKQGKGFDFLCRESLDHPRSFPQWKKPFTREFAENDSFLRFCQNAHVLEIIVDIFRIDAYVYIRVDMRFKTDAGIEAPGNVAFHFHTHDTNMAHVAIGH
jgi:hypothetical protein